MRDEGFLEIPSEETWAEQQRTRLLQREMMAASAKRFDEQWKKFHENKGFTLIKEFVGLKPQYGSVSSMRDLSNNPPNEMGKLLRGEW